MAPKKATLFIDSSNTYHRLKENNLYKTFSYKWLCEELSKKFNIGRVFLYDAIKNYNLEPKQFSEQQKFHEKLKKEIPNLTIRQRKLKYLTKDDKIEKAKKDCGFCTKCIRKTEDFLRKAGLRKLSKEKGIDVLLVADMIKYAFQDKYETALLLTGDADFIPAVELAQSFKKEVINIHCYAGSSGDLRNSCDSHTLITSDAKGKCFLKYY